jgi:hypothetical protein
MLGIPTAAECRAWARVSTEAIPDDDLDQILAAELDQQARTCVIPPDPDDDGSEATYPPSLARALLRRVQRACAFRNLAFGFITDASADYGPQQIATWDGEISRLEATYRQHVVA